MDNALPVTPVDDFEVIEEPAREPFVVDDDSKADWAMRKLASIRRKQAENTAIFDREVARVSEWLVKVNTALERDAEYVIILRQRNPWGTTKIQKKVSVPYKMVEDVNPNGEAFFIPKGGAWSGTPISYDYIFSGDAENVVSAQTSNNYTTVPFPVSGNTKSRLSELAQYGPKKYMVGVPVIYRNQIWGVIDGIEPNIYTAYTINQVQYYDFPNGVSIYYAESSGLTENNITAVPITKDEILIKVIDQPQILTNVFVERGKNSAYERIQRLGEVDNLGDMINYGYGYYGVKNADKNYL